MQEFAEVSLIKLGIESAATEMLQADQVLSLVDKTSSLWRDHAVEISRVGRSESEKHLGGIRNMNTLADSRSCLEAWLDTADNREFFHFSPLLRKATLRCVIDTTIAVADQIIQESAEDIRVRAKNLRKDLSRALFSLRSP